MERPAVHVGSALLLLAVVASGCASSGDAGGESRSPQDGPSVTALADDCAGLAESGEETRAWQRCDRLAHLYVERPTIDPRHARRIYAWTCRRGEATGCQRAGEWGRTLSGRKQFRDAFERGCRLGSGLACKRSLRWTFDQSQTMRAVRGACRNGVPSICPRVEAAGHRSEWVVRVDQIATTSSHPGRGPEPEAGPVWGVEPTTLYGGFGTHLWQCRRDRCIGDGLDPRRVGPETFNPTASELMVRRVDSGAIVQLVRTPGGWFVWRPFGDADPVRLAETGPQVSPLGIGPDGAAILGVVRRKEQPSRLVQWSARTGGRLDRTVEVPAWRAEVEPVAFGPSPDPDDAGARFTIGFDKPVVEIRAWPSLERVETIAFDEEPWLAEFGPDGRRLAVNAGGEGHLYTLPAADGREPRRLASVPARAGFAFGPNGDVWAVSRDEGVDLRDPDNGSRLAPTIQGVAGRMAFDPSGGYLAIDGYDRKHNTLITLRTVGDSGESEEEGGADRDRPAPPRVRPMPASMFEPQRMSLGGRVTWDESKEPVEGAEVAYEPDDPSAATDRAQTGPDGRFRLEGLISGKGTVRVEAFGADVRTRHVEVPDREQVEMTLSRSAVVRGRITRADGSSAAGAHLRLKEIRTEDEGFHRYRTETDEQGRFVFGHVDAGGGDVLTDRRTYRLEAWHRDGGYGRTTIEIPAGETIERDLALGDPDDSGVLRVRVTTETGEPVEGASVTAHPEREGRAKSRPWEKSDAAPFLSGSTGPAGWWMTDRTRKMMPYDIDVGHFARSWAAEPEKVTMPRGTPVRATVNAGEIRVVTEEGGLEVWGRQYEDPVLVRTDVLTGETEDSLPRLRVLPNLKEEVAPVRFVGLAAERWTLVTCELHGQGCGIQTVELEPDETVTLTARTSGGGQTVTGRVRAAGSGVPLAGVRVETDRFRLPDEDDGDFEYQVRTDPAGRFRFEGLVRGPHHLEIRGDGLRPRDVELDVSAPEREGGAMELGVIDVWTDEGAP